MVGALISKDLREHRAVAGAALLLGTALAVAVLRVDENRLWIDVPTRDDTKYVSLLAVLAVGYGLLLGALQSWKEELGRTWPFLLHRPATRGTILGAKLAAGALLYFPAIVAPAAFVVAWSAVPGHYPAPFEPLDVLPHATAIACGYAALLAAFAAGLWGGALRWLLPLGGAAVLLIAVPLDPSRSWAGVPGPVLAAAALSLGASWHLLARGSRSRVALATLVALGVTGLCGLADAIVAGLLLERGLAEHEAIQFAQDGAPRLFVYEGSRFRIETLDRDVVARDVRGDDPRLRPGSWLAAEAGRWNIWTPWSRMTRPVNAIFSAEPTAVQWFLDFRRGLILGYERPSRALVAVIGRDGPAATVEQAARFPPIVTTAWRPGSGMVQKFFLFTEGGAFEVDYGAAPSVRRIGDYVATSVGWGKPPGEPANRPFMLIVRSGDRIGTLRSATDAPRWFPIPEPARAATSLFVWPLPGDRLGIVVPYWAQVPQPEPAGTRIETACEINAGGQVAWKRDVTLTPEPETHPIVGLIPGVHPLLATVATLCGAWRDASLTRPNLVEALPPAAVCALGLLFWSGVAGSLLGGRGLSRAQRAGWTAFAFFAGLGGVVAIRLTVASETRLPCPGCGRARAPSVARCEGCGAGWPRPERRETDLFGVPQLTAASAS